MHFSSASVCEKQFCLFRCPLAKGSLRRFPLEKSKDAAKNHFDFAGKLHVIAFTKCFHPLKDSRYEEFHMQLSTFHLRRLAPVSLCCMSVLSLISKESSDGQLFFFMQRLTQ